jgi:hypothetical protein
MFLQRNHKQIILHKLNLTGLLNHSTDHKLIVLIFSFFFLISVISSGGHLDWWDGVEAFLVTESMVLKNTAQLDPSVPSVEELSFNINYTVNSNRAIQTGINSDPNTIILEPVYTVRSLLLSALGVPFYYLGLVLSISPVLTVGLFVNSLFISLTAAVIFCIAVEVHRSKKIAFILGLIFSVCSFVWPYNSTFWVQPLQGLTLALSTYFLIKIQHYDKSFLCHYLVLRSARKGFFFSALAGLFLGLSVFAHPTSLIFVPAFVIYALLYGMRHNIKNIIFFVTILAIVLFCTGFVNYLRFASFTEFGYGYFSSLSTHDGWRGLIGILISPGAGLVFYFPPAVLLPLAAKYFYKENKALYFLCTYIIVANWIYIGTLSFGSEPIAWSGGIAWGPRYLIPVLPFIIVMLGSIFLRLTKKRLFLRIVVIGLCVAGFYVNLSGILIWFQYGLVYGWQKEGLSIYPDSLDIMTWNPFYSPIVLHTKALITDYVSSINPVQYLNTSWYWTAYGTAPCSYDIYLYCNYGIIPIIAISVCIVIISVLIAVRIRIGTSYLKVFRLLVRI